VAGSAMKPLLGYLRRHHLALLALFVALGGSAYAAHKIGSGQIRKNAVKARHIAPNAVRARQIAPNAVGDSEANESSFGLIRTGRIVVDAPSGGSVTKAIFSRGPFQIASTCQDTGGIGRILVDSSGLTIHSSAKAHASSINSGTGGSINAGETKNLLYGSIAAGNEGVNPRGVYAVAIDGRFINISILEVNRPTLSASADCVYHLSGFGN
jgi:hypothetical protein